jgi:uncharacterized protein (DUF1800 family)
MHLPSHRSVRALAIPLHGGTPFVLALCTVLFSARAQTPDIVEYRVTNGVPVLRFAPVPAVNGYVVERAPAPAGPFTPQTPAVFPGFQWLGAVSGGEAAFYRVRAAEMPAARLAATTLLNRIAYGPEPGDVDRVAAIGPAAYIEEQLAPENISEDLDHLPAAPVWQKVTAVGTSASTTALFYLDGAGDVYLDDVRLVSGVIDDGSQPNLIADGDFEAPLDPSWKLGSSVAASARTAVYAHSGSYSLHLVATAAGGTTALSLSQLLARPLTQGQIYSVSFWYLPLAGAKRQIVARVGSGLAASGALSPSLDSPAPLFSALTNGSATIADLRAWHVRHAVQSKRQLLEVLDQFLENHFVTEFSKSTEYLFGAGQILHNDEAAAGLEFAENLKWRQALLNPGVTFYDLLKISAESPAMIIYLDTVASRGNNGAVANENYARELNELFCFGVNNGYDQNDIVQISRVWTGWNVEYVDPSEASNPFAKRSTNYVDPNAVTNRNALTNLIGTWAFNYKSAYHNTGGKQVYYNWSPTGAILDGKKVPARFGPPWAGSDYSITLSLGSSTNSIQEGYQLLRHMANLPFTEEFIAVKLCRLLVHENFQIGYDFTDPNLSPEGRLVHDCMMAWENPGNGGPKGQLRPVLRTILNSPLLLSNSGSMQKVKTPLEFAVSLLRAFRVPGAYTAVADGYAVEPFTDRAGGMKLFDRQDPDGYPEDGGSWISAGTLVERIRFAVAAMAAAGDPAKGDAGGTAIYPTALLQLDAPNALTDGGAAADYFVDLLFPAEGAANLAEYRRTARAFLNTAADGVTVSSFSQLAPGSVEYDARLRGLCAWLLGTQRFQEQ